MRCNYIYKGSHVLATNVIISGQFPDLAQELGEADKLKAAKHMKAHPLEKHLEECLAEWKMYIKMMKENGQIPADAEEVEYPYTKDLKKAMQRPLNRNETWVKERGSCRTVDATISVAQEGIVELCTRAEKQIMEAKNRTWTVSRAFKDI